MKILGISAVVLGMVFSVPALANGDDYDCKVSKGIYNKIDKGNMFAAVNGLISSHTNQGGNGEIIGFDIGYDEDGVYVECFTVEFPIPFKDKEFGFSDVECYGVDDKWKADEEYYGCSGIATDPANSNNKL